MKKLTVKNQRLQQELDAITPAREIAIIITLAVSLVAVLIWVLSL